MIKIRYSTFETNSSSTHSIVVSNEDIELFDYFVVFGIGEFGWEMDVIDDTWGRASYFYTAACSLYERDVADDIIELLTPLGIECVFDKTNAPCFETYDYDGHEYKDLTNGHIDHVEECKDFVDALMCDGEMLKRFLFNDHSFIVTGNDNCDEIDNNWMESKVGRADTYAHTLFYKGN